MDCQALPQKQKYLLFGLRTSRTHAPLQRLSAPNGRKAGVCDRRHAFAAVEPATVPETLGHRIQLGATTFESNAEWNQSDDLRRQSSEATAHPVLDWFWMPRGDLVCVFAHDCEVGVNLEFII